MIIIEGKSSKGGRGLPPKTQRPPPPKGQGEQKNILPVNSSGQLSGIK